MNDEHKTLYARVVELEARLLRVERWIETLEEGARQMNTVQREAFEREKKRLAGLENPRGKSNQPTTEG